MSIKLTNDVKISSQSLEMLGFDKNNIIASGNLGDMPNGYTPNEDVVIIVRGGGSSANRPLYLNDVEVVNKANGTIYIFCLKANETKISTTSNWNCDFVAYKTI